MDGAWGVENGWREIKNLSMLHHGGYRLEMSIFVVTSANRLTYISFVINATLVSCKAKLTKQD